MPPRIYIPKAILGRASLEQYSEGSIVAGDLALCLLDKTLRNYIAVGSKTTETDGLRLSCVRPYDATPGASGMRWFLEAPVVHPGDLILASGTKVFSRYLSGETAFPLFTDSAGTSLVSVDTTLASLKFVDASHGTAYKYTRQVSLDDAASHTLPDNIDCAIIDVITDDASADADYVRWYIYSDGTIARPNSGASDTAESDSAGDLCLFDSGTNDYVIKNNRGSTLVMYIHCLYSVN